MTDREKVIKGLKCCASIECAHDECPYVPATCEDECVCVLCADALELIEKQERNIIALYKKIKWRWDKRRTQDDATDIELKFLVALLDWLETDEFIGGGRE